NLIELERFESKLKSGPGSFGGVAAALEAVSDAPADFHAGREVGLEIGNIEANEADEISAGGFFDGEIAEAVLGEMILDARCDGIAFFARQSFWEVAHDAWIGVHGGEGGEIGFAPRAQGEA